MTSKIKTNLLLAFAAMVGLVIGYLNPVASQALLSVLGTMVGIGMFFLFRRSNKKAGYDFTESWVYLLLRMLLFFVIGAALGGMVPYYQLIMETQQK